MKTFDMGLPFLSFPCFELDYILLGLSCFLAQVMKKQDYRSESEGIKLWLYDYFS